ncbi:unnamed protein product, partial [Prorocentrum cordatum]
DDISGQINFSLAVNLGTGMQTFGRCVVAYVKDKLQIKRGEPPPDAVLYRKHLIRLCMARGSRLLAKRLCIQSLPNGDWRRRGVIEVYVPEGIDYDRTRIADVVGRGIQSCVAGRRFKVYPRSRWTGADQAFDEFVMMEAIHGMVSAIWATWCSVAGSLGPHRGAHASLGADRPWHSVDRAPSTRPGDMQRDDTATGGGDAPGADGMADAYEAARMENEQRRRKATDWLRSRPLSRSIVIRQTMEPLRQLRQQHLAIGGKQWQRDHQQEAARSADADVSIDASYPIVVAASGELEKTSHYQFRKLFEESGLWDHLLQPGDMNVKTRNFAFRLCSAADCLVYEAMDILHNAFPIRMFKLLNGSSLGDVLSMPPCCMDDWSKGFVGRHGLDADGAQLSPRAMSELRAHAAVARMHIAAIETRHASIRRRLESKSVQTSPYAFTELSADFVLDHVRIGGMHWPGLSAQEEDVGADGVSEPEPAVASVSRPGGAWRCWVREQSLGKHGLQDSKELSARYRALSPEEKEGLVQRGAVATRSGKDGSGSSFGLRTRDLQRAIDKRRKEGALQQATLALVEMPSLESTDQKCDWAIEQAMRTATNDQKNSVNEMMKISRENLRTIQKAEGRKADSDQAKLVVWHADQGEQLRRTVVDAMPCLKDFAWALQFVPGAGPVSALADVLHPTGSTAKLARSINARTRQTNLGSALDHQWVHMHRPIYHDECDPIPDAAIGKPDKVPCQAVGVCCCSPPHREKARRSFYSHMKACFKKVSGKRKALEDRIIVAKLTPIDLDAPGASSCDDPWSAALAEVAPVAIDTRSTVTYWHVATMSFSPYVGHFRELNLLERVEQVDGVVEYTFEVNGTTYFDRAAFKSLDLSKDWAVEWLVLSDSVRAVPEFRAGLAVAVSTDDYGVAETFWSTRRRGVDRGGSGRRKGGADDVEPDVTSDLEDGDDDGCDDRDGNAAGSDSSEDGCQ